MINPDSMCASCANCIIHESGDVDFLCDEECMRGRLTCSCYRPRVVPDVVFHEFSTSMDSETTDLCTVGMLLSGKARDAWYEFISRRRSGFEFTDGKRRLIFEHVEEGFGDDF